MLKSQFFGLCFVMALVGRLVLMESDTALKVLGVGMVVLSFIAREKE